ncbi:hypothetical protein [Streptomyces sp. NPDC059378]|uniref:hypothetical protein n=1 Tax=Streptomyces sp. NPDC059378 TaxID=3346815 RepID=UPI0036CA776C
MTTTEAHDTYDTDVLVVGSGPPDGRPGATPAYELRGERIAGPELLGQLHGPPSFASHSVSSARPPHGSPYS